MYKILCMHMIMDIYMKYTCACACTMQKYDKLVAIDRDRNRATSSDKVSARMSMRMSWIGSARPTTRRWFGRGAASIRCHHIWYVFGHHHGCRCRSRRRGRRARGGFQLRAASRFRLGHFRVIGDNNYVATRSPGRRGSRTCCE